MQTKKRIVAMILTVVMIFTTVNFLPGYRAKAEETENVATDTDAQADADVDAEVQSGVAGAIQDELPIMRLQPGGVGTVKVTGLNTASYGGTSFSSFALSNGCIGFCTNHAARPIGQNSSELNSYDYAYFDLGSSQVGLSAGQQSQIKKILFYGYNGLANQLTGYSAQEQIAYTTDAMQYVICGRSYISGNPLFGYINDGWPEPPASDMSFTPSNVTATYNAAIGKQVTPDISFSADVRVGGDVTLPAGAEMYFVSSSSGKTLNTPYTGTVRIAGGDTFYMTMPADADTSWTGTVSGQFMTNVYEVHSDSWARTGSGVQGIMFATNGSNSASFTATFAEQKGSVAIIKSSADATVTSGNGCYSLQGAVYKMYRSTTDAMNNSNAVATFITDANGYAVVNDIPLGTYVIKETQPPKGYALDGNMYPATVTASHTPATPLRINSVERPQMDPVRVLVTKLNSNGTGIAGAEYTFKYYREQTDTDPALAGKTPERTWVMKTNEAGTTGLYAQFKVSGDEFYYNPAGNPALPLGTLTIQETKAPEGYVLDDTVYVRQVTPQGTGEAVTTYNAPTVTEETIRGDLAFTKVDAATDEPIADVKFEITDVNGESHIVWTDEDGYYSTASSFALHSKNTNSGNAGDGVWFGSETVDDTKGALPYGIYTVKELRCAANQNKYKDLAAFTVTISDNGVINDYGKVLNERFPSISTTVKDSITDVNIASANEEITAIDTVTCKDLEIGHKYTVTGYPVDKATGEKLKNGDRDIEGSVTFTADKADMSVDVSYLINTDGLAGKDIVFYEFLYDSAYPNEVIAVHQDITDEGQTLHFPDIHTTFTDGVTGEHISLAEKEVTQVDRVAYTNLKPGLTYKVSGSLVYQDNGETVKDAAGREVTAETTFVPEKASGTVDIVFKYDASLLAGNSVVAFEDVYYNDRLIASHTDITDEGQTIDFPKLSTVAKLQTEVDSTKKLKEVSVIDSVYYTNLVKGEEYKIVTTVMVSEKEALKNNGETFKNEKIFICESEAGTVDVNLVFNAEGLSGKSIVIYEELYLDGKLVATHKDINSKEQTITFPPYTPPDTPKTGDRPVWPVVMLFIVAGTGIVILIRKRKTE